MLRGVVLVFMVQCVFCTFYNPNGFNEPPRGTVDVFKSVEDNCYYLDMLLGTPPVVSFQYRLLFY